MKLIFKTLVAALSVAVIACTVVFAGCTVSLGADGRDGQDVSIYDIYEATNQARADEGLGQLTFLEFISEYLSYDGTEAEQLTSLQTAINRSLLSSVQVTASFEVTTSSSGGFPFWQQQGGTNTYYSQGSGVIIDLNKDEGDMYIVTNCHVVFMNSADEQYSTDINVYIYGKEYSLYTDSQGDTYIDETNAIPATIVGTSINYDIALLKVEDSDVVKNSSVMEAVWSTDENVSVGQTVYAVGNAAGDGISATNGIICVDSENITLDMYDTTSNTSDDFTYRTIRTSVPIYSGNSGGGLFNAEGQLVGIINSKTVATQDGEYSDNISHALPAANVRRVVQSMIDRYEQTGEATNGIYKAVLGVTAQALSSSAYMNNDTNLVEIIDTVEVSEVSSGSLADGSLQSGDQITGIKICDENGTCKEDVSVTRMYNLTEVLISAREGDSVTVTVLRSGEENPVYYTFTVASSNMQYYL